MLTNKLSQIILLLLNMNIEKTRTFEITLYYFMLNKFK